MKSIHFAKATTFAIFLLLLVQLDCSIYNTVAATSSSSPKWSPAGGSFSQQEAAFWSLTNDVLFLVGSTLFSTATVEHHHHLLGLPLSLSTTDVGDEVCLFFNCSFL
jgi:hypothetical protein